MTKKQIADTEPAVPKKPRAPRSSAKTAEKTAAKTVAKPVAKPVTHKHKKSAVPVAVTPVEEAPAVMAAPAAPAPAPVLSQPTTEEISRLAYSYWEARGYQGGSADEDWARAEWELRSR